MKFSPNSFALAIVTNLVAAIACAASLVITDAGGLIVIQNGVTGERALDQMFAKGSPFASSHEVFLNASQNSAQYDWAWSGDSGNFESSTNQHLQGIEGYVDSAGGFLIRTSVPSLVSIDATYSYDHPPQLLGSADLQVSIRISGTNQTVFSQVVSGGTFGLGSPTGILELTGSAFLNPNVLYVLGYDFITDNFTTPPPTVAWLGSGQINLSINPIPEPTMTMCLALLLLFKRNNLRMPIRNSM